MSPRQRDDERLNDGEHGLHDDVDMLLLSSILPVLTLARHVSAASSDTFGESLTLHPLPDGKLSVLFEFTTHFTGSSKAGKRAREHFFSTIH